MLPSHFPTHCTYIREELERKQMIRRHIVDSIIILSVIAALFRLCFWGMP